MTEQAYISKLIATAERALQVYENFTQAQVDACIKAMCLAFRENARILAEEAVEETGFGDVDVKEIKNRQAADAIWYTLKDARSVGVIDEDREKKLIYVAKPVGVIAAITPSTNPSTTIAFNACYALKGRNAVIFSTHPGAAKTSAHTLAILQQALREAGAPEGIVQYIDMKEANLSDELMSRCDLSLVAGNEKTVHRGYSSGRPCIGVSHGNVQTIVDRGWDYERAVRESVYSCGFDNGLICACTQAVLVPEESRDEFLGLFRDNGAQVLTDEREIQEVRSLLFPDNQHFDRSYVGKPAGYIAAHANIQASGSPKILLIAPDHFENDDPLLSGEMSPVCLLLTYDTFQNALRLAGRGLSKDGAGHSVAVYTDDPQKAKQIAEALPITRVLVNQPAVYAANQQIRNGLNPTANLGCGSWANNSLSENVTYRHLLNICRISWAFEEGKHPTQEQIWA